MHRYCALFVVGLLLIVATAGFAQQGLDNNPAAKEAYYNQVEEARVILEQGGELTPAQINLLKGEGIIRENRGGEDELDRTGGPDDFGYEFIDSQEDDGPTVEDEWIDISDTGTEITGLADDNHVGPFDIGFDFPFYDNTFDQFWYQSNGTISFAAGYISLSNQSIPTASYDALIAWNWDDLNPNNGGTVYYETVETDQGDALVIQMVEYHDYSPSTGWIDAEIIMYENGKIFLLYDDMGGGMTDNSQTIGIQDNNGDDGLEYVYNGDPENAPFADLAIKFASFEDAHIQGTVSDADGDALEDAQVELYYADEEEPISTEFTDADGWYDFAIGEEATFDIRVFALGYEEEWAEDLETTEADTLTQDFEMTEETATITIDGNVYSADTPDTPVEGITVALPQLGLTDVTDADGYFDFGAQTQGFYTIEIYHDPAGSEGYHDATFNMVSCYDGDTPLEFDLYEILPVTNLAATTMDEAVSLAWDAPSNMDVGLMLAEDLERQISGYQQSIEYIQAQGTQEERNKLHLVYQDLHRLQAKLRTVEDIQEAMENGWELDEITDFAGYRVKITYPNGTEDVLDDYYQGTSTTVGDLINGTLYTFHVGADYGYGEDYIEWSNGVTGRPLPVGGYIVSEVEYDWIEINPDEDGDGEVARDNGDDSNSGEITLDELTFNFFGEEYSSFGVCTNGWMSFTNFTSGSITVNIPNTSQPNAVVQAINGDYHAGVSGDDMGIWYLEDTDNNQVIIQYKLRPYSGGADNRYSYQIILDCEDNSITFNYQEADDWAMQHRGPTGIENEDGTEAYIWDWQSIEDEYAVKFRYPDWDWAGINGVVLDANTDDPVQNARVVATDAYDDTWVAHTDANGWFTVLADDTTGPWDLDISKPGYYTETVTNVTLPEDSFDVTIDDVYLDGVPIGYEDDFEDDQGPWDVSDNNIPGDFEWGAPTAGPNEAHSGDNVWAQNLDGNFSGAPSYGATRGDTLWTTQSWYVGSEDALLAYWHWHEYYQSGTWFYNGYNVQISTDFGETWDIITPIGGYDGSCNYMGENGYPGAEQIFGGVQDSWEEVYFELGDYFGEEIMLMFHAASYYYTTYHRYGVAIDDFRLHGVPVPSRIEGTVTDSDDDSVIEGADINLWLDGEVVGHAVTDENGFYSIDEVVPSDYQQSDYDLECFAPFYMADTLLTYEVAEGDTQVANFALDEETRTSDVFGTIYSEDTPDTPVEDISVTIPQLDETVTTNADGEFDFGEQTIGIYTIVVHSDEQLGYHETHFYNRQITEDNASIDLLVPENLPPATFSATDGDMQITLNWTAPENLPEMNLNQLREDVNAFRAQLNRMRNSGDPQVLAKLPEEEQRLFSMENRLARLEMYEENEIDDITDFQGYRIYLDGEVLDTLVNPNQNSYVLTGLFNGHEYTVSVAADYGYDEDFLVWALDEEGEFTALRPLPPAGYIFNPMDYEWIEINPDEGGDGEVAINSGDDQNSGEVSFAPLEFEFYGNTFSSFGACTNGWMSFTEFASGWIGPTIPATSNPNNTIIALNGDYHAGQAGDDLGIWYLVDEGNDRVIIQFRLRPYSGSHTDYRHNYQVVLDCETGSLHFNYQESEDWMEYVRANGVVGVENGTGTVASTFNMSSIVDNMSLNIRYVEDFGNVVGYVTDQNDDPVEGAYVFLQEDQSAYGMSDENGYYEILLANTAEAPYTVVCHADGYESEMEQDVDWEEGEFDREVNFSVTPISAMTAPYFINWDVDFDDRVQLVMGEPGSYDNMLTMQYDDGTAADAWVIPADGEDVMWATPFESSSEARIVQTEVRVAPIQSAWGNWPDAQSDPVVVKIFADNDGQPGEALYTSEPTVPQHGAVVINPSLEIDGLFWVGFHVPEGREALCVDTYANNGEKVFLTIDGTTWQQFDVRGDPMVRVDLHADGMVTMIEPEDIDLPEASFAKGDPIPVAATFQSPVYGRLPEIYSPKTALQEGWNRDLQDELDEFLGFNVYYSTDGEDFEQANDELIEEATWDLILGSDMENNELWIYATAWVDSAGEEFNSNPSDTLNLVNGFNMEPAAPTAVTISNINHPVQSATVSWTAPTMNADGTPLVDLEGYDVSANGIDMGTTDVALIDVTMPDPAYYTFSITAFDEVPNMSVVGTSARTRIGNPPFFTSFEEDVTPEQPNPFESDGTVWEHGEPAAGPGEAYEGDLVWATYLDGNYNNNDDSYLTSTHGWEPADEVVLIRYFHWLASEGYYDGYNFQVSIDGGDNWEIVDPDMGYNYANLYGISEPGFAGNSGGWQEITYDIGDVVAGADSFHVRFHFGTDGSVNSYYGVAIDNLEMWGVPPEDRVSLEGFVMDANDDPMEGVSVYVQEYADIVTYTDATGYYFLFNIPADTLTTDRVIAEYPYYWPSFVDTTLIPDDTMTVDFTTGVGRAMRYPDGEVDISSLEVLVDLNADVGDSTGTAELELSSNGTGPLQWYSYVWQTGNIAVEKQSQDGRGTAAGPQTQQNGRMMRKTTSLNNGPTFKHTSPQAGPIVPDELDERWDWLFNLDVGSLTGNDGCFGVFANMEGIFVSAVYLSEEYGDNFLYEFDHQGAPIAAREYPQDVIGSGDRGPLDLAWDPVNEVVYGGNMDGDVYSFTTDMTDHDWITNVGYEPTGLAYDFDQNYLYSCNWNMGITLTDLETGGQAVYAVPQDVGPISGLAYNPMDLEGYNIYVMATDADGNGGVIHRFDPMTESWDVDYHVVYEPDFGSAGGMEITLGYHDARYDVATLLQGATGDLIDIWEGQVAPLDWLWSTPDEGLIEPEENESITIHVDIRGKVEFQDVEVGDEISAALVFGGPYWAQPPTVDLDIVFYDGLAQDAANLPTKYALHQNYPNPFNPQTQIKFDLVERQNVRLTVFNVMGQEVMRLVDQPMEAGYHAVTFDASRFASGMYFYRIEAGQFTSMKKMVLVK